MLRDEVFTFEVGVIKNRENVESNVVVQWSSVVRETYQYLIWLAGLKPYLCWLGRRFTMVDFY